MNKNKHKCLILSFILSFFFSENYFSTSIWMQSMAFTSYLLVSMLHYYQPWLAAAPFIALFNLKTFNFFQRTTFSLWFAATMEKENLMEKRMQSCLFLFCVELQLMYLLNNSFHCMWNFYQSTAPFNWETFSSETINLFREGCKKFSLSSIFIEI